MLDLDVTLRRRDFTIEARIHAAEGITVLFGPSGAGKSLTLRCVAGLIRPDEGRIVVGERVLFDSRTGVNLPPQQRQVGYVPQDYALFPHLTVAKNVAFGVSRQPRLQIEQAVGDLLTLVGLAELATGQCSPSRGTRGSGITSVKSKRPCAGRSTPSPS